MISLPRYARKLPVRQRISIGARAIVSSLRVHVDIVRAHFLLWRYGASVGKGLRVSGRLRCFSKGAIVIGNMVRINSGPDNNYVGGDRRTNLWVAPDAKLVIEDCVGISNSTLVARTLIHIRYGTLIGGGCDIYDTDFHPLTATHRRVKNVASETEPVSIGPDAFVGGHTIVLKGVTIGEGAVVGAGSIVTKNVPPFEIWAGRPARFVKRLIANK